MKLFQKLLVAPAALGLLAPLSVSASEINLDAISNYSNDLEKGDALSKNKVIVKRPALGIRSRYFDVVAQAKLKRNVAKDEPINWEDLEY